MDFDDFTFDKIKSKSKSKKPKSKVRDLEIVDRNEFLVINSSFPPRASRNVQSLLEYRVQLMSKFPFTLKSGESLMIETSCFIQEDVQGCMYIKANPNIPLVCEEHYVKCENHNIFLKMYNFTENTVKIPQNVCVGYLIISL